MKRSTFDRLNDILDAAERARRICPPDPAGMAEDTIQLSLTKLVEIIGEAANHVDAEVRAAHPGIPWRKIVGMRNHTVHNYVEVDLYTVWAVVAEELPRLVPQIKAILETLPDQD
ncbi:DUF86 domain-containing protein [Kutzneria viridogrisea]|uniref:DUF86 domain-containing protein n=2 Tax=Kutzneria TaxID=43356 RepID=W5WT33_9PSEU|nr:HepT-like ribonuclease domain-containing protein [Kutzneria albida]AHI01320.1 hypothetical protein KALB_7962 [Kutzneria albida DSM 43870]MBA8926573.1 uncharacterized protein with HEPN domain [Kutzneria viridogrisea]